MIEDRKTLGQKIEKFPMWDLVEVQEGEKTVFKMSRKFVAKSFKHALDFIAAAGIIAETMEHHPDLHVTDFRNVEVVIYTHTLGGLTDNDFALAKSIDESALVTYSPKWLKEHPSANFSSATLLC